MNKAGELAKFLFMRNLKILFMWVSLFLVCMWTYWQSVINLISLSSPVRWHCIYCMYCTILTEFNACNKSSIFSTVPLRLPRQNNMLHKLLCCFLPGPQPASVMELPAQEGPSTSRDPVPITYRLKVSEGPVQTCFVNTLAVHAVILRKCVWEWRKISWLYIIFVCTYYYDYFISYFLFIQIWTLWMSLILKVEMLEDNVLSVLRKSKIEGEGIGYHTVFWSSHGKALVIQNLCDMWPLFHLNRSHPTFSERACCLLTGRCFISSVIWMWKGTLQWCHIISNYYNEHGHLSLLLCLGVIELCVCFQCPAGDWAEQR